jgi:integrase
MWVGPQQVRLATGPKDEPDGPCYTEALAAFRDYHALLNAEQAGDRNPVRVLCEKYLVDLATRGKPQTITKETHILRLFCAAFGETECRELKPTLVYDWLSEMAKPRPVKGRKKPVAWGPQSRRLAVAVVSSMLNWCAETRLIPFNPLGRLRRPSARSRGRDALLGATPEERAATHALILATVPVSLRPLCIVLEATGCRPGELCAATAADFDRAEGSLRFRSVVHARPGDTSHKTAAKEKERIIVLQGEALSIVAALAVEVPSGKLFRTRGRAVAGVKKHGGGWTSSAVADAFGRVSAKLGIPSLTAYSYRHTFATAWLEQHKPIDVLASLLGNTEAIIRRHYSHLLVDFPNLRSHLAGFSAAGSVERADTSSSPRVFVPDERERA